MLCRMTWGRFCAAVLLLTVASCSGAALAQEQQQLARQSGVSRPDLPQMDGESQKLFEAGLEASEKGRFEDAILDFNQVVLLNFNSPKTAALAHYNAGNAYLNLQKYGLAAANFQRAIDLNPRLAMAYNNLGEAYGHLNEPEKALAALKHAVEIDPELPTPYYNLGVVSDMLGRLREAQGFYRRAVRLKPDYALAYDALAVALTKQGRASEAIAYHQKAISLNPRDSFYHFNLALSYLVVGYQPGAIEEYKQLRELNPGVAARLAQIIEQQRRK